jgi:hypothetical protein
MDDGNQPYGEAFLLIERHLNSLKHLAGHVDVGDRVGFCLALNNQKLVDRANIVIDLTDPSFPLFIEAPSLLRFMMLEMWSEFGGERPAHAGVRTCAHCGSPFLAGGRRGGKGRRGDARYCSESCKNMASRLRRAGHKVCTIPQP